MIQTTRGAALALSLAALLAACASKTDLAEKAPVESRDAKSVAASTTPPPSTGTVPQSRVTGVDAGAATPAAGTAAMMAAPAQRIVYFDFDSFVIKDEFKPVIEGHAKVLMASASRKMVVEGHADERGGSEYNLALGQKRAQAVVKSLTLLGVGENQLEAVSYGKERPADPGHDEAAWAKNRRAELKDR